MCFQIVREAATFQYNNWQHPRQESFYGEAMDLLVSDTLTTCPMLDFATGYSSPKDPNDADSWGFERAVVTRIFMTGFS